MGQNKTDWTEEARQIAAQCWCEPETSGTEMDVVLAGAFAKRIATWMETAAQAYEGLELYRNLLDECAKHLGPAAFTADDGTLMEDPVRLKIPELVEKLVANTKGTP